MTRAEAKEKLRVAATEIIRERPSRGYARYLLRALATLHDWHMTQTTLRKMMKELVAEGHFTCDTTPSGCYGYRYALP